MRVWMVQPKVMSPIVNDPNVVLRVQPGLSKNNQPIFTAVAQQMSVNGNPIHTAIAVFTSEIEAHRFIKPATPPSPKAQRKPARFVNTPQFQEAA